MDSGDRLARGARGASFQVHSNDEVLHDLKTLTKDQFTGRYDCDAEGYALAITALKCGGSLPTLHRRTLPSADDLDKVVAEKEVATMPPGVGAKVTVRIPEKPIYRADARGDNVLVTRVEREHSAMFLIPESARAKSDIGRVTACGPHVTRCKVGELVLFDRFAAHGKEIEIADKENVPRMHLLLNDVDILLGLERFVPEFDPDANSAIDVQGS